jgi:signal transduction histidine kinase
MLSIKYLLEIIRLYIVMKYIFQIPIEKSIKKPNIIMMSVLILFDISRIIYMHHLLEYDYDDYLCILLPLIMMLYAIHKVKYLFQLLAAFIIVELFGLLLAGGFAKLFDINIIQNLYNPLYMLLLTSINVIPIILIAYIMVRKNIKIHLSSIGRWMAILIIVAVLGCAFFVAMVQLFSNGATTLTHLESSIWFITFGGVSILIIIALLVMKVHNIKNLEIVNDMQMQMLEQQRLYYSKLLQQEEDTKAFRHDINNHLFSIRQLMQSSRYDEVTDYIDNLTESFNQIQVLAKTNTGSEIINVLFSGLLLRYKESDIELKWSGLIPNDIKINNTDLCGLFSNLLKNAFEAASAYEGKRFIKINISDKDDRFYIAVRNTSMPRMKLSKGIFATSKSDKVNHGFGTQIIQNIVSKYDGMIHNGYDANEFTTEIIFTNIM